jgi:glycosyltransferase involved in cell wall biosynthesis
MTCRCLALYATAIHRSSGGRTKPAGVWLITNNFSTGGAQSSARRLLLAMRDAGIRVRAAVIQENPDSPTPGRAALQKAGIKIFATLPPEQLDAEEAVSLLLDAIVEDPPEAVLFWNLITSYKVLLADRLVGYRLVDVSPGEMFFDSMTQYFSNPRPGLPYRGSLEYGENLSAAVVKYKAECPRAAETLGCKVEVIPNGVPMVRSTGRQTSDRLIIGTAARLSPQKRLEDLVEALRLAHPDMPRYELRIAGSPERGTETYARFLRKLGGGLPIRWCGEVRAMDDFLSNLDVFVMISEPSGCPNASLEALAHGIPVIATAVGGSCEQIEDRVTGRLVPPRDARALATAIIEIAHSRELRQVLADAGFESVRSRFGMSQMLTAYLNVLGLKVP